MKKGKYYLISMYAIQDGTNDATISLVNLEGEDCKILTLLENPEDVLIDDFP